MSKTWHRKRAWYDEYEDDNESQQWRKEKRRKIRSDHRFNQGLNDEENQDDSYIDRNKNQRRY